MHIKEMDQQSIELSKKNPKSHSHSRLQQTDGGNKVLALLEIESKVAAMHNNKVMVQT